MVPLLLAGGIFRFAAIRRHPWPLTQSKQAKSSSDFFLGDSPALAEYSVSRRFRRAVSKMKAAGYLASLPDSRPSETARNETTSDQRMAGLTLAGPWILIFFGFTISLNNPPAETHSSAISSLVHRHPTWCMSSGWSSVYQPHTQTRAMPLLVGACSNHRASLTFDRFAAFAILRIAHASLSFIPDIALVSFCSVVATAASPHIQSGRPISRPPR